VTLAQFWKILWDNRGKASALGGVIFTVLFGQGVYWRSKEAEIAWLREGREMWAREESLLADAIKVSALYGQLQECDPQDESSAVQNKKVTLMEQLKLLQRDFAAVESGLARLESRKARDVQLDMIPPPAPSVSVEVHVDGKVVPQDSTPKPPPPACPAFE
jgi:hypothetical protein